jgi:hypothetical protein
MYYLSRPTIHTVIDTHAVMANKLFEFRKVEPGDFDSCNNTHGSVTVLSKKKKVKTKNIYSCPRVYSAEQSYQHLSPRALCALHEIITRRRQ